MSATAAPAASDRSDVRTVTVGGALVGAITAGAVVLVVATSRLLAGSARAGGVEALLVRVVAPAVRPPRGWPGAPPVGTGGAFPPVLAASAPAPPAPKSWRAGAPRRAPLARPSARGPRLAAHADPSVERILRGTLGWGGARHPPDASLRDAGRRRGGRGAVRVRRPRGVGALHAPRATPLVASHGATRIGRAPGHCGR